jgi:hypothetical protein
MQTGGPGRSRASQTSHTSGGPTPDAPQDPNRFGLPDLGGAAPRQTPRVAQTGQPRTLGVTNQMARTRSTGSPSIPPRPPSITAQMRAVAPPDVARQTIDEQKMLASELLTLPDALETSGLAKTHESSYIGVLRSYVKLADETWLAIAEERLEQSGADPVYRQNAITVARLMSRMRNESQLAANNTQFQLPRKRPFLWRRRVRLHQAGLLNWQSHLNIPANPRAMGSALARLRGATALAQASGLELLLWSLFPAVVGDVLLALLLGLIVSLIGVLAAGATATVGALALDAVVTLALWLALALVVRRGPARLDYLYALSVLSPLRSPRAGTPGSPILAGLLRAWGVLLPAAGLLGMAGTLGYSIWQETQRNITLPTQALDWVALVGSLISRAIVLPALVGLAAVGVLALPFLLLTAVRFVGELGGNIGWVPAARRYALTPALHVLGLLAAGAIAVLANFSRELGLSSVVLASVNVGSLTEAISLQTIALFVIPALLLLAGADIPFRVGVVRWRNHWLRELTARRTDLDGHVRRLSAADPQTGMQDTSDENLRAMQYDMVLLQFYTTRTDETRRVSSAPYGWLVGIGVVLLLAVVALLVDGVAQQFANLLLNLG